MRPPRLRYVLFSSIYPPHLLCFYECGSNLTLLLLANSSLEAQPFMRFLFVGPEVCLQLPSDSTSRWTPLLFSYTFPTTWACSGLAPIRARPWRAYQKNPECNYIQDKEVTGGFEPPMEVLQTCALPLGYVTKENITKYDKFHNTISK